MYKKIVYIICMGHDCMVLPIAGRFFLRCDKAEYHCVWFKQYWMDNCAFKISKTFRHTLAWDQVVTPGLPPRKL